MKFRQIIQANMIWKWKTLSFSSFETRKPNVKFWICEVTKPKLKPKPLPICKAEAEAEPLSFWNHEAEVEAEAEALASNASALWSQSQSRSSFAPMSVGHVSQWIVVTFSDMSWCEKMIIEKQLPLSIIALISLQWQLRSCKCHTHHSLYTAARIYCLKHMQYHATSSSMFYQICPRGRFYPMKRPKLCLTFCILAFAVI